MSSLLQNNTTDLQNILDVVNSLPEAGVDLPELSNPAVASDILSGKESIDQDGNIVTGNFSLDTELSTQDSLIAQIVSALEGKAGGSGANAVWGLLTPASTNLITIEHGLGKRPVAWGLKSTLLGSDAPSGSMGHLTYVRKGIATGELTKDAVSFSGPAENKSAYGQHGIATEKYFDTESSDEISETTYYTGSVYVNKNYIKILPGTSRSQKNCVVGDTYIWYVLGID